MKKNISKILSLTVLGLMSFTSLCFINPNVKASASTNILLGDADNDGYVNMSDCVYIIRYLYGAQSPNAISVTAMDVNEDYVIDMTDANIIQYMEAYSISPTTKNKNLYTVPNNTGRYYYKHQCSSQSASSYTQYYLSAASNNLMYEEPMIPENDRTLAPDQRDYENINVVELTYGNNDAFLGSGFIVNNHVVATAAHCVYGKSTGNFTSNVKVKIYNQNGAVTNNNGVITDDNLLFTAQAKYIHIPKLYVTSTNSAADNYDYALIYVDEDLLQQNIYGLTLWQTGVATKEFMNSNRLATTSGFRWYNNILARYYNEGNVQPISSTDHNNANLRITTTGTSYPGKSGGVVYYKSSYSTFDNRSAIAVVTGAADPTNGGDTWGTRINPTLLRFFFQNPYI